MRTIPSDYLERVYAGVLGKVIGVYLGRPFEGWSYERILAELGEIQYYVHDRLKLPLIVTDDDITGTFTFIRALDDFPSGAQITSQQIGQAWLNYIIENRSILWWGGLGNSTEHTAYLRLKQGIMAPRSGSIALNGRVVAEQIGAQIFIDGWGMVCPGDPQQAAALAGQAARVSHDGEAVFAAQVIAAMEAQAFVEPDLNRLLNTACGLIPHDSILYRLINDVRDWHAEFPNWRQARAQIAAHYGYDKYPGNCHVMPNHALVLLGLLYGGDNFQRALSITNTSGWDTDCNSANVGCLMGIKGGLAAIDAGPDWRGPVADRMYLPTAEGGRAIYDCVQQSVFIANLGRKLAGQAPVYPKDGARFHFDLPGAVQGFTAEESHTTAGTLNVAHAQGAGGAHCLALNYHHLAPGRCARASTATFIPPEAVHMPGYGLDACPTLYPGQTIRADLSADPNSRQAVRARLYIGVYNENDALERHYGPQALFTPGAAQRLEWTLRERALTPVAQVGIEIEADVSAPGALYLETLTWDGAPDLHLSRPQGGPAHLWQQAWVPAVDAFGRFGSRGGFSVIQNHGRGLLMQGTREWTDYRVSATITPHLLNAGGIAVRVQGLRRYYALLLKTPGLAQLIKMFDGEETVLAAAPLDWQIEQDVALSLAVQGGNLRAVIDGSLQMEATDAAPLRDGGLALVCEEGYFSTIGVDVSPL